MRAVNNSRKNLCCIINQARASGRGLIRGIFRFAESRPGWRIHLYEPDAYGLSTTLRAVRDGLADGILTSELEDPDFAAQLERSPTPLVVIGTRRNCLPARTTNMSDISFDEEKIGAFAAQSSLNLGRFKSFGFIGSSGSKHSYLTERRFAGFQSELRKQGLSCSRPRPAEDLSRWIRNLAKPAVIVGCVDDRAADVIDLCEREGVSVPNAVCVIGIDNSETICQASHPTLSSVATDFDEAGFSAAAELDRIMRRKMPPPRRSLHCATQCAFVRRNSTRVLSPGLQLVNRALEYIDAHAGTNLTADRVADGLHVSRRLLYLRFREFSDKGLHETIVEKRLEVLKRKLASSRQSIAAVTSACGFANQTHVKTLFKRKTGLTIGEWRKRQSP